MHMADALISPAVGATAWVVTAGLIGYASKKMKDDQSDQQKIPLMGVLGAFIFAAMMINFSIPGTGSSGHLGGGMLLAILLGPYAAFLTMASILTVQALFFADGGILALGCNIFNLGFFPCFIVYPLIFKKMVGSEYKPGNVIIAAIVSAIVGLELGAFSVVLETIFSGKSELSFSAFVLMMLPIHLAIGIVEGIVTAAAISFVVNARPEILPDITLVKKPAKEFSRAKLIMTILVVAGITGGFISWFASAHPDGLEWSIVKTTGKEELETPQNTLYATLANLQEKTAFLPDYDFKAPAHESTAVVEEGDESWPAVNAGTTVAGIVGGLLTFGIAAVVGFLLRMRGKPRQV